MVCISLACNAATKVKAIDYHSNPMSRDFSFRFWMFSIAAYRVTYTQGTKFNPFNLLALIR